MSVHGGHVGVQGHRDHQHHQDEQQPVVDHLVVRCLGETLWKKPSCSRKHQETKVLEKTGPTDWMDDPIVATTSIVVRVTMMRSVKLSSSKKSDM